jgi:hypothetical protein
VQLLKKLFEAMGAQTPTQKIYTAQVLPEANQGLAPYPRKEFLGAQAVFAYRLQFMVKGGQAPKLMEAIRKHFPSVDERNLQEGEHRNGVGEAIHFAVRSEFNGATVEMLTNSDSLMLALDALQLEPPPPWVAFPNIDPDTLGSRQGAIEYWWNIYWQPFWACQSSPENQRFNDTNKVPIGWDIYLRLAKNLAND